MLDVEIGIQALYPRSIIVVENLPRISCVGKVDWAAHGLNSDDAAAHHAKTLTQMDGLIKPLAKPSQIKNSAIT